MRLMEGYTSGGKKIVEIGPLVFVLTIILKLTVKYNLLDRFNKNIP